MASNWTKSFSIVLKNFCDYADENVYSAHVAILINDLCIKKILVISVCFNIDELAHSPI